VEESHTPGLQTTSSSIRTKRPLVESETEESTDMDTEDFFTASSVEESKRARTNETECKNSF